MKDYNRDTPEYIKHGMLFFNCQLYGATYDEHWQKYVSIFKPHGDVVDMGCGNGEYGVRGIADGLFSSYIGITDSEVQKNVLNKRNLNCIVADMCDTTLPDKCADTVMFNESIGYVNHFDALKEASRLLKDGGIVCVKDFTPRENFFVHMPDWGYSGVPFSTIMVGAEKAGLTLLLAHRPVVDTSRWGKFMQNSNMPKWHGIDSPNALSLAAVFLK